MPNGTSIFRIKAVRTRTVCIRIIWYQSQLEEAIRREKRHRHTIHRSYGRKTILDFGLVWHHHGYRNDRCLQARRTRRKTLHLRRRSSPTGVVFATLANGTFSATDAYYAVIADDAAATGSTCVPVLRRTEP